MKSAKSSVPVLMLTAIKDEYTQVTSFDEQADDYVTKPFSMVLLGRRIMALLRRNGNANVLNTIAFDDVIVDFSGYTAKDPNGKIDITPKEIDLLKLLVEHKGLVLTRTQILDNLWGSDASIIDRTVDVYIRNLRKNYDLTVLLQSKELDINMRWTNETTKTISENLYIYALSYVDDSFIGKWNVLSPGSYYDGGRCNNC